jgi:hypothetical protein
VLRCFSIAVVLALPALCLGQDVASGPEEGKKTPPLKVHALTGPVEKETIDYAARRSDKTTVYVFVPKEKWSRPMHRFLFELGRTLGKSQKDALVVAIWLTDEPDAVKEYLPKIAQYYENTALALYEGEKAGPQDWNINDRADATVVATRGGTVLRSLGYVSVNETLAKEVADLFKKK